ncbi:MAG: hypothetical protein HY078_00645 [Elusimicrobia bacterium]|nr:hypothetical protein [Elusimicrobiota bacterium]
MDRFKSDASAVALLDDAPVPNVAVDHPRDDERILSNEYSIRISAAPAGKVEISIDGGEWQPCREAVGHWWYDWSGYGPGRHRVVARLQPLSGRKVRSMTSHFLVILE